MLWVTSLANGRSPRLSFPDQPAERTLQWLTRAGFSHLFLREGRYQAPSERPGVDGRSQ